MLRLALTLALWLSPVTALAQPFNTTIVTTAKGTVLEVPKPLFFDQLELACHTITKTNDSQKDCLGKVAYMSKLAQSIESQMVGARQHRIMENYGLLREAWRKLMDDNLRLSAASRDFLATYPKARPFVQRSRLRFATHQKPGTLPGFFSCLNKLREV